MILRKLFNHVRYDKLKQGDCFKSARYPDDVFQMQPAGRGVVCLAFRKGGGTRYFEPGEYVKRISLEKYNASVNKKDIAWANLSQGCVASKVGSDG